jgi:citrate synthase
MSRRIEVSVNQEKGLNCNVDFYSASTYHARNSRGSLHFDSRSRCAG